jgi:hypothetical protein
MRPRGSSADSSRCPPAELGTCLFGRAAVAARPARRLLKWSRPSTARQKSLCPSHALRGVSHAAASPRSGVAPGRDNLDVGLLLVLALAPPPLLRQPRPRSRRRAGTPSQSLPLKTRRARHSLSDARRAELRLLLFPNYGLGSARRASRNSAAVVQVHKDDPSIVLPSQNLIALRAAWLEVNLVKRVDVQNLQEDRIETSRIRAGFNGLCERIGQRSELVC